MEYITEEERIQIFFEAADEAAISLLTVSRLGINALDFKRKYKGGLAIVTDMSIGRLSKTWFGGVEPQKSVADPIRDRAGELIILTRIEGRNHAKIIKSVSYGPDEPGFAVYQPESGRIAGVVCLNRQIDQAILVRAAHQAGMISGNYYYHSARKNPLIRLIRKVIAPIPG